jgi:hypothetical protein
MLRVEAGIAHVPGVQLDPTQRNALNDGKRLKLEMEKEGFIPGRYYSYNREYAPVRGPYFFWCVGCNGGSSSGGGDGKGWMIVAAIVAAIVSIVTLVQAAVASGKSKYYAGEENSCSQNAASIQDLNHLREKQIYQYTATMLKEAGAERKTSAMAIFILGGGLAVLSVGLLMAYAANVPSFTAETLIVYGSGAAGLGLIGYGVSQLHYKLVREPKINEAYVELNARLAQLEAMKWEKPFVYIALIKVDGREEIEQREVQPPAQQKPQTTEPAIPVQPSSSTSKSQPSDFSLGLSSADSSSRPPAFAPHAPGQQPQPSAPPASALGSAAAGSASGLGKTHSFPSQEVIATYLKSHASVVKAGVESNVIDAVAADLANKDLIYVQINTAVTLKLMDLPKRFTNEQKQLIYSTMIAALKDCPSRN